MKKVFLTDIRRLLRRKEFYFSILGIACVMFFSLERKGLRSSMLESYIASVTGAGIHISGVFCALACATVFCEDIECGYIHYVLMRTDTGKYVFSKLCVIYLAAVFVMCMGTLIFCSVSSLLLSENSVSNSVLEMTSSGNFGEWVLSGQHLVYCLLYSLQFGMYMGLMAAAASCLSLFTANRVLVLTFPVLLEQFLQEIPADHPLTYLEFSPILNTTKWDWQAFLYLAVLCAVFLAVCGWIICRCLKKAF